MHIQSFLNHYEQGLDLNQVTILLQQRQKSVAEGVDFHWPAHETSLEALALGLMADNPYEAHGLQSLPRQELGSIGADELFRLERPIIHKAGANLMRLNFCSRLCTSPHTILKTNMTGRENQECLGVKESAIFRTFSLSAG